MIGLAYIDENRCLPGPTTAVPGVRGDVPAAQKGDPTGRRRCGNWGWAHGRAVDAGHIVIRRYCIGCGICENRCPLDGEAAIRVYMPTDLS